MSNKKEDTFCKKMRKATKEIHATSDALVNAKLTFAFSDNSVWADGLLMFYEIFRYLEGAMVRLKNTKVGTLDLPELRRTEAFESDLEHYLGKGWTKDYIPRDSVIKYLMRLREIEDTDPTLLMAYIYHLYMGLLSGGVILRKKRKFMQKIMLFKGTATGNSYMDCVTDFHENNIYQLKKDLRDTMNDIAESLDEDTRNRLIEESRTVYTLNNEIIRSVRGVDTVLIKKVIYFSSVVIFFLFIFLVFFKQ